MAKSPWSAQPTAGNHQHLIWDESGKTIAVVYTDAADAELITRSVNAHDALVEALETLTDTAYTVAMKAPDLNPKIDHAIGKARAALLLAKGA